MSSDPFINGLKAIFAANPSLKPARVSKEAGLSQSAIRKLFENDGSSPTLRSARLIAAVLGMTFEEVVAQSGDAPLNIRPTIAIAGKVGAGAQVPVFDAYAKGDGPQVECPPGLSPHGVVAVEVEGDSMEPMFSAGDLLFYTRDSHDGVPADVIGHRCVVEDEDGMGWVKQVKAGDEPGLFHLISLNPGANTMWNKKLKWAARVRLAWPAELARKA
ncbi:helix-turn-helix domain-containing protein [Citreicella sp. C3M06]|uniref:LexA family transcriptional regulator n=1 Tax=Citreicella sp. C3M06 TaxID=2841564 RepID=UPI001C091DB1|nr:S24 family peptidase [Citreicella sp. C3M06]MBU2963354.1 helix-turn-helix domain-containing protein [Citreicella sp. C3M06]